MEITMEAPAPSTQTNGVKSVEKEEMSKGGKDTDTNGPKLEEGKENMEIEVDKTIETGISLTPHSSSITIFSSNQRSRKQPRPRPYSLRGRIKRNHY